MPPAGLEIPCDMPLSVRQASGGLLRSACFAMPRAHMAATNMEEYRACCQPGRQALRVLGMESARGARGDPVLGCMHCWQRQSARTWLCSRAGQLPSTLT